AARAAALGADPFNRREGRYSWVVLGGLSSGRDQLRPIDRSAVSPATGGGGDVDYCYRGRRPNPGSVHGNGDGGDQQRGYGGRACRGLLRGNATGSAAAARRGR
ncbi:unnamed protein product, partial [Ectocarpus sp. 12 AP-2014]